MTQAASLISGSGDHPDLPQPAASTRPKSLKARERNPPTVPDSDGRPSSSLARDVHRDDDTACNSWAPPTGNPDLLPQLLMWVIKLLERVLTQQDRPPTMDKQVRSCLVDEVTTLLGKIQPIETPQRSGPLEDPRLYCPPQHTHHDGALC